MTRAAAPPASHDGRRGAAMKSVIDPRRVSRFLAVSRAASGLAFAGGAAVLLGWQLEVPALTSIAPGRVAMNPLTALGFMLAAVGLRLSTPYASERASGRRRSVRA